ncbi:hypothetical protein [Brevundimonas goettingensis]|uniref:Secreted protein n=1 Tax=Brevundimonas goettingensis TaxID=2774190 RepID=A0A975GWA3_9CAUL|nr:hypothetical protein [Brevundimonas goettingensis]QTC91554.1 hypothetical protein IFJ75_01035 [Brevundimonas goettingensis]
MTATIAGLLAALTAASMSTVAQTAPAPALISYDETVRCAGVTQAASELEGGETAEGKALSDSALYWSLAATQAAQASNRDANVADADQNRARIRAVQQLNAGDADAKAALQRCRARTPDLG